MVESLAAARVSAPLRGIRLGPAEVDIHREADGVVRVRSRSALAAYPNSLTERLVQWARVEPRRTFLAARKRGGEWQEFTYAETLDAARIRRCWMR